MSVEAILLGAAQDGGVPQAGCTCVNCRAAWDDPTRRRRVACLGLIDHAIRQSWLIDATPDFREQLHHLHNLALWNRSNDTAASIKTPYSTGLAPECPLAGIVLTHAHVGHYTGLIHLGREAWNTRGLPVHVSPSMADFLRCNAPWSQLVAQGNIRLRVLSLASEVQLSPDLHLTVLPVPHRDEFSDTLAPCGTGLAFVVRGPARRLLYCPDIDTWDRWEHDLRTFVTGVDVALLDGTFFSTDELHGRDLSQIPHPLVSDTAERLAGVDCDVRLIHLNHSNPLHRPGPGRDWLAARGIGVGVFGERWSL